MASSRSSKATGSSGTQSNPYYFTRQVERSQQQPPYLAVSSASESVVAAQMISAGEAFASSAMQFPSAETQMPGHSSSHVRTPFASASSSASHIIAPDQLRPASKQSSRSERRAHASEDAGARATDQTVVRCLRTSTSNDEDEESHGAGGLHASSGQTSTRHSKLESSLEEGFKRVCSRSIRSRPRASRSAYSRPTVSRLTFSGLTVSRPTSSGATLSRPALARLSLSRPAGSKLSSPRISNR